MALQVSCESNPTVDKYRNVKRSDMKEALLNLKDVGSRPNLEYDNLNFSKLLAEPPPPPIGNGELISFSITEDVSLKDVFIELGRLAEIDIQIDPKISGGIILKITEKPINIVIDKICELANLRYEYKDGILKVERDLPYAVNYSVDILVDHELWSSIESSIQYILDVYPVRVKQQQTASSDVDLNGGAVESAEDLVEQKISINKEAGVISVYANSKAHRAIDNYIREAKKNYAAQVIIEAKVVQVALNDNYQAGINWSLTSNDYVAPSTDNSSSSGSGSSGSGSGNTTDTKGSGYNYLGIASSAGSAVGLTNLLFTKKIHSKNLNVVIDAMQEFGDTKTISSPRISTLNNQTANLNFTNTLVYFSVERDEEEDSDGRKEYTYTSTKQEEEVGVKLEITPTINLDKQEVTLKVKPELSSPGDYIKDPVNEGNEVPQINKRTLETSLKIRSGDVMVIGGLMEETNNNSETGVPFLMNIPILGNLFRHTSKKKQLTETVIFIKATIVNTGDFMDSKDRKIYNDFDKRKEYDYYNK